MTFNQKEYYQKYYLRNREHIKTRNNAWKDRNPKARAAHVAKSNEKNRLARNDPYLRARFLWRGARKRNKEFLLSLEYVETLINAAVNSACPYTKMPFDFTVGIKGLRNPWAPSLDRKDNDIGYVEGNVEVVSVWWNTAKNEWSDEVMKQAVNGLKTREF